MQPIIGTIHAVEMLGQAVGRRWLLGITALLYGGIRWDSAHRIRGLSRLHIDVDLHCGRLMANVRR